MNLWPFGSKNSTPPALALEDVKRICKILMIDNQKPVEILAYLKRADWHPEHLGSVKNINCKQIAESHIICIDILDVGIELGLENGLKLIKPIKDQYPEKRILVYSSRREHDFFDECSDLIDKKVVKSASPLPFESAISELAKSALNWDDAIEYTYSKLPDLVRRSLTLDAFKDALNKNTNNNAINLDGLSNGLKISKDVLAVAIPLVKFALDAK